jgi:tRNA nucleotidyltransferase (CCA-adding enzyme)
VRYNVAVMDGIADKLMRALTPMQLQLIQAAANAAGRRGWPLYAVGGLPRDAWLGRPASDVDLVVEGDAIDLARHLAGKYGGRVTAHGKFGTANWDLRQSKFRPDIVGEGSARPTRNVWSLDVISARREAYSHPASLPTVRPGTIVDDLHRRDFTINTLAVRLDGDHFGEMLDDFGATADLERGLIRTLHAESFLDDPTRMYRAVRYEQRFGFKIARESLTLIPAGRSLVGGLSGQRIRHELDLIMGEDRAAQMLGRLSALGLVVPIHPLLPDDRAGVRRVQLAGTSADLAVPNWTPSGARWTLWLLTLTRPQLAAVARRLHMPGRLTSEISAAAKLSRDLKSLDHLTPSKVTAYLDGFPPSAVYTTALAVSTTGLRGLLRRYLAEWRHVRPATTGHDLKALGLVPGPEYRSILRGLRAAWLDGVVASKEEERLQLKSMLSRRSSSARGPKGRSAAR